MTAQQTALTDRSPADLAAFAEEARAAYDALAAQGLSLDLTRGKPAPEQLDLADGLMGLPTTTHDSAGTDVRNYGGLAGLADLRSIFAELLGVPTAQLVASGNSSLVLMREVLTDLWIKGGPTSERPWGREEKVRFLCPSPGYDRHFTLLEWFGIEMVAVPQTDEGPDVDAIERLVAEDPTVKGMWVVPTYANPTGTVVSQRVADRLGGMATAAPDFTILWDNAYALHHLTEDEVASADLLSAATAAGHAERVVMFASTSKISWAGAGVGFLAGSPTTVEWYLHHLGKGAIGPDKVNHLRHAQLFGDAQGVRDHMAKHRDLVAPKFAEVDRVLGERLGGLGVAEWTRPLGGYFVSVDVLPGTASRVIALAKDAGVALTPAGSAFPYGQDPDDTNIRLAPTFPSLPSVVEAMEAFCTCVRLAAAEKLAG
ncbi:aminotransferase class I/II-fold pyridoxal phosphate-dependent enzyme [Nocardioides sp. CFH 31398]|uniref:aminotransferase class I/II-fold pyridoxal phosphate-dependent enzyme n=1 Tax=Nocardioides sp. CFH 31398 TaxID=2919579 RepID=UPI001F06F643|nr:aminotransferase class I/II-fold pyridoxal phosphate-dependent enzyme [Nocardioides sp. CFH 31398]MCH1865226.1 aminotransferase class I/II-fold pyridoxal phosphate-dependent enzyme [Nocardioides sp. CFH 31398]